MKALLSLACHLAIFIVTVADFATANEQAEAPANRPNVLFIAVDDLRPELGCYGDPLVQSPHIDRLAAGGMRFDRAYCQQAICMSSRASLLSGYRPDKAGIYRNGALFSAIPDALTLNQHFANNGYETISLGKIYHHRSDYAKGWTLGHFLPMDGAYLPMEKRGEWFGRGYLSEAAMRTAREHDRNNEGGRRGMGPAFESPDVADDAYPDGFVARHAIEQLRKLKGKPFFMATGFYKPHLPFNAPKKYWDLYDPQEIKVAENPFAPRGAPRMAATGWGELRGYYGMPLKGPMSDELARDLIHGYYACVSYTDAMIGRVLDELEQLGLADNTVVVLWGDHGWKLGEHGMWCKHTNFEIDTRVPLILRVPGSKTKGQSTKALVELVDLYPTLCELCGLELPKHLEGTSMAPLIEDPQRSWKQAAFSQYPRSKAMGYSMRTDRYRYTEWRNQASSKVVARELYDLEVDPASNQNIADDADQSALVQSLASQLSKGYRTATP